MYAWSPSERRQTWASPTSFVVKHARDISLHFSRARGTVTVLDGYAACASNVPVKLQFFKKGRWRTVASAVTKANGNYNLGNHTASGKYRALAKKVDVAGNKCLKDRSPVVRL